GKTALQTINPLLGLEYTGRTLVDSLVLGVVNATGDTCPDALVPVGLAGIGLAGWCWWRVAPQRQLMLLGLRLILVSYGLMYSARAGWPYRELMARWTRYHLFPFLGLVFFVCGGLPSRQGTLFQLRSDGTLTRAQLFGLGVLITLLLGLQLPAAVVGHRHPSPDPAR